MATRNFQQRCSLVWPGAVVCAARRAESVVEITNRVNGVTYRRCCGCQQPTSRYLKLKELLRVGLNRIENAGCSIALQCSR